MFDVQFEQEHKKQAEAKHETRGLLFLIALRRWVQRRPRTYEVRHVQGNVYMFASTLGNVTIQVGKDPGHDGVLLVDTGAPACAKRSGGDPKAVGRYRSDSSINTSADADHIGSNEVLLKPTPELISCRPKWRCSHRTTYCSGRAATDRACPVGAWPTLTYLDGKSFVFNGEAVQIFSEKARAHRWRQHGAFRGSNVLSGGRHIPHHRLSGNRSGSAEEASRVKSGP